MHSQSPLLLWICQLKWTLICRTDLVWDSLTQTTDKINITEDIACIQSVAEFPSLRPGRAYCYSSFWRGLIILIIIANIPHNIIIAFVGSCFYSYYHILNNVKPKE